MMKTRNSFHGLSLAFAALCFFPPPVAANLSDLLEMDERAEQSDKRDLQGLLEQANSCTRSRNFTCSEEQLRKAGKLVNDSHDKQALNSAQQNLQSEKNKVAQEARDKAERERQIQLAEERSEAERKKARKEAERKARAESMADASVASSQPPRNIANDIINDAMKFSAQVNQQTIQLYGQAQQNQRDRAAEQQRQADEAREQKNERIRRQNQRIAQQEQDRQQEQEQRAAQTRRDEQVRQQEQARKKADAEAAKAAEKKEPESKVIAVRGNSGLCFSRDIAESQARTVAKNSAFDICDGTGGWKFPKLKFDGYIQCTACTGGERGNFRCEVDQVTYTCFRY
jgi:hypothetical protein